MWYTITAIFAVVLILTFHKESYEARKTRIPLYVINLKRRPDRLRRFAENVGRMDWHIVEAVDGRDVDLNGIRTRLTKGEIGCFLSHLKALDIISRGDDNYAIVLEDDGFLPFPKSHAQIQSVLSESSDTTFGAIALGCNAFSSANARRVTNRLYQFDASYDLYGAHAILYSKQGARAYLDDALANGFKEPYDLWLSRSRAANLLVAYPPIATVQNIRDSDTQKTR